MIIDRFEEDIAVIELNGEMLHAPRALFAEAKEGDTVELTVLPRRAAQPAPPADDLQPSDDDAEAVKRRLEENVLSVFKKDKAPQKDPSDDPAAFFQKLRNKKKR